MVRLGAPKPAQGQPWRDDNCELVRNSTLLWNIGKKEASVALLCGSPRFRAALERSGSDCAGVPGAAPAHRQHAQADLR